jgi:hypothetical protein
VRRTAPGSRPQLRRAATGAHVRLGAQQAGRATGGERRAPTCPWHPRHAQRGARHDHGAPHPRPHFSHAASAHHPSQEICVGPAAPGMTSLTRCTAAKRHVQIGPAGPCRWVPPRRTSARAARRGAAFCLARHTLRLSRARAATGRAAALHPHGHQIRTGVRWFSLRRLLYFAAVRAPGTVGSGFRIMLLNWGGAMGIRTPDLLHAMQVRQPACQRHHRPLPADLVHPRARGYLPGAGCWLSTWLSAISL